MITKAALLLFREVDGVKELMFVRDHKPFYVFPGGKQNAGETIEQALARELLEELSCEAKDIEKLGVVEGATPDGRAMQMHLFSAELTGEPVGSSEIQEIAWMSERAAQEHAAMMTPMTRDRVFPFLKLRKLW